MTVENDSKVIAIRAFGQEHPVKYVREPDFRDDEWDLLREEIIERAGVERIIALGKELASSSYTDREKALFKELGDVEAILAEALGYTYDEDYGWDVGDHVPITLAREAAEKLKDQGLTPESH